jgi:O-antigen biosynthesis protein WbqV
MATRRALNRIAVNVALDALLAAAAVPLAHWLAAPMADPFTPWWMIPWGAAALLVGGLPFGLSVQYWRFAGVSDLLGVAAASIAAAAIFPVALHEAGILPVTAALPAVHALVLMVLLSLPRIAYRLRHENPNRSADTAQSVLLVGAAEGADLFLRALAGDRDAPWRVGGLLTLGNAQTGRRIHGHPILGALDDAAAVLERLRDEGRLPGSLVVTDPDLAGPALAALMDVADRQGLRVLRAPRPTALDPAAVGAAARVELKPVAIEDLLNRPQVPLDRAGMARLIQGRRVLVTGAGGSIGSELSRQVAALGPDLLILLDNGEFALWQIDLELRESMPQIARRALIADVRDAARIRALMDELRPDLVFHAAALKHVPIVEHNPLEGMRTNAVGTRNVADAARATGAQAMVLISTDKAVNPSSIMGASKRLAEMYCQGLDMAARAAGGMRCITVRFGNVLGSTGSVVPLFQRQLARGGPLTVTHPDMERYFMTVREAVGLVLQASVVGTDDHAPQSLREGGIFVLDMGSPVKIVDLARQMIRLAGLRPDVDIPISFTGIGKGEKLFEEMFHGREPPVPTEHPGLLMATPRTADPAIIGRAIDEIASACQGGQTRLALALLGRLVPEFNHNADGTAESAARR